jgi:hypothetical protein
MDNMAFWKAPMEGKHKCFARLLVHSKILTTDQMMLRDWNCNLLCSLCGTELETAAHLCMHCPFALQVRNMASDLTENFIQL